MVHLTKNLVNLHYSLTRILLPKPTAVGCHAVPLLDSSFLNIHSKHNDC